jgi:hypothetical protein
VIAWFGCKYNFVISNYRSLIIDDQTYHETSKECFTFTEGFLQKLLNKMATKLPGIVIINYYSFSSTLCIIVTMSARPKLLEQDNAEALIPASSAFTPSIFRTLLWFRLHTNQHSNTYFACDVAYGTLTLPCSSETTRCFGRTIRPPSSGMKCNPVRTAVNRP